MKLYTFSRRVNPFQRPRRNFPSRSYTKPQHSSIPFVGAMFTEYYQPELSDIRKQSEWKSVPVPTAEETEKLISRIKYSASDAVGKMESDSCDW